MGSLGIKVIRFRETSTLQTGMPSTERDCTAGQLRGRARRAIGGVLIADCGEGHVMVVLIVALYYSVLSRIQERPTKNRQLPVEARACGRRTSTAEPPHRDRCACWDTELYFWDQWSTLWHRLREGPRRPWAAHVGTILRRLGPATACQQLAKQMRVGAF